MGRSWTFGQKVGAGFVAMVILVLLTAGGAIYALNSALEGKDRVIAIDARNLILAEELRGAAEWKASSLRGFLLLRDEADLEAYRSARDEFLQALRSISHATPGLRGSAVAYGGRTNGSGTSSGV